MSDPNNNYPVYPKEVIFRFPTRTCATESASFPDSNMPPIIPQWFTLTSTPTQSPGDLIGIQEYHEQCVALFDAGSIAGDDPTNLDDLQNLADQFTLDSLNWLSPQFDVVYVGVINFAQSALFDVIEVDYSQGVCKTRAFTRANDEAPLRELGHQEPNVDETCPDISESLVSSKTPCVEYYGPGQQVNAGNTILDKYLLCLEDGRLVHTFVEKVTLPCGCGTGCCDASCLPCSIPFRDLKIAWVNLATGNGSDTLAYNPALGTWTTGCSGGNPSSSQQVIFKFQCNEGNLELQVQYFVDGPCPTGTSDYCSNLRTVGFELNLSKSKCFPFSIEFDLTSKSCPALFGLGFTSFTVSDPNPPPEPPSGCCVTICALNCLIQKNIPGVTITITDPATNKTIATGVTGKNGCILLDIKKSGKYTITSSNSPTGPNGFLNFTQENIQLTCCQTFSFQPGAANVNVIVCGWGGFTSPPSVEGIPIEVVGVGSGFTDVDGNFNILVPSHTTKYTVTAEYNGITAINFCILPCIEQIFSNACFYIGTPTILGCIFGPVEGATVTVTGAGGSQTTLADGVCPKGWIFPTLCPIFAVPTSCDQPPNVTVTASYPPRFQDTILFVDNINVTLICIPIQMIPADGYICVTGCLGYPDCNLPIKNKMAFTDACLGGGTATWNPVLNDWIGSITVATSPTLGICPCPASSTTITYGLCTGGYWTTQEEPCGIFGGTTTCPGPGPGVAGSDIGGGVAPSCSADFSCPEGFIVVQCIFPNPDATIQDPWTANGCTFPVPLTWTEA